MGIFVTDLAFATPRLPVWGETVLGGAFRSGPGGKGSNQAVAAARLGGRVSFISKLGRDDFGSNARAMFAAEGIDAAQVRDSADRATGAAVILVDDAGENAIVVVPGAAFTLTTDDVGASIAALQGAKIFLTQLELPVPIVAHGLTLARRGGMHTILNPAPAAPLSDALLAQVDCLTPNETEAAALTGLPVTSLAEAQRAAAALLARGPRAVVITLGAQGALVHRAGSFIHVPAFTAGAVVDTTGAGDAFNGALAVALAQGQDLVAATRFACAAAAISVTRPGTAPSMASGPEVAALMRGAA